MSGNRNDDNWCEPIDKTDKTDKIDKTAQNKKKQKTKQKNIPGKELNGVTQATQALVRCF